MRSKEVEEAIKNGEYITTSCMLGESLNPDYIVILLNYIKELEKLPNKIRNKIEEYKKKIIEAREEDDDNKEFYYEQEIEVLKELLGE